jgi:hypothetical protein
MVMDAGDENLYAMRSEDGSWTLIRAKEDVGCMIAQGNKSEFDNGI